MTPSASGYQSILWTALDISRQCSSRSRAGIFSVENRSLRGAVWVIDTPDADNCPFADLPAAPKKCAPPDFRSRGARIEPQVPNVFLSVPTKLPLCPRVPSRMSLGERLSRGGCHWRRSNHG